MNIVYLKVYKDLSHEFNLLATVKIKKEVITVAVPMLSFRERTTASICDMNVYYALLKKKMHRNKKRFKKRVLNRLKRQLKKELQGRGDLSDLTSELKELFEDVVLKVENGNKGEIKIETGKLK